MDSEHRHELAESDLVHAWEKFKVWWARNSTTVLGVAVVAAALILAVRYFRAKAAAERESEQWMLASETGPENFRLLAAETGDDGVEAQANLRGADVILAQIARPPERGQPALSAEKRAAELEKAEGMCKSVLSAGRHPLLAINARLRLATIAEARGNWDQAKAEYQAIQKDASAGGYEYHQKLAAAYEKMLPRVAVSPVFAKEEVKSDPTKSDPFKFDPLKITPGPGPGPEDSGKSDPLKITPDPAKPDPSKTDPAKTPPSLIDPPKFDPAKDSKPDPAKDAKIDPAKPKDGK